MKSILIILVFVSCQADGQVLGFGKNGIQTLRSRLSPTVGTLKLEPVSGQWDGEQTLEPSLIAEAGGVKIYYTGSNDHLSNQIGLIEVANPENTWTRTRGTPIIGSGYGGAPADRKAHSSCVVKSGSTYYAYATNGYGFPGEDRCVYLYTSSDGISFTSSGKIFDTTTSGNILGYGNTTIGTDPTGNVVQVGGYYHALLEVWTGSGYWEVYYARSTSLTTGWTRIQKVTDLQGASGKMYSGGQLIYSGGAWHCFPHYAPASNDSDIPAYYTNYPNANLPTFLGYAKSTNLLDWDKMEYPFLKVETNPFTLTDQIADPYWVEFNGKTYLVAEYVDNDAAGGYDNIRSQLRMWVFNGTFAQLMSGITNQSQ